MADTCDGGTLLVAEDLGKVYGEGETATHALRGVSVTMCEGEFAATGANGNDGPQENRRQQSFHCITSPPPWSPARDG